MIAFTSLLNQFLLCHHVPTGFFRLGNLKPKCSANPASRAQLVQFCLVCAVFPLYLLGFYGLLRSFFFLFTAPKACQVKLYSSFSHSPKGCAYRSQARAPIQDRVQPIGQPIRSSRSADRMFNVQVLRRKIFDCKLSSFATGRLGIAIIALLPKKPGNHQRGKCV